MIRLRALLRKEFIQMRRDRLTFAMMVGIPLLQLTLFGFFTSQPGATQVLRYEAVPGEYIGDLEYKGEPAWAT